MYAYNNMVIFVVASVSIIILYFLTNHIAYFFDIGVDIYGIYLMVAIVAIILQISLQSLTKGVF
jgi:hypothetical protein